MDYIVRRGEQEFGPYSLTELQTYAQSGHVQATDLTKNEAMADWEPVSLILGTIPSAPAISVAVPEELPVPAVALPWNLHWSIIALLVLFTRQYFNFIWVIVLANWARKLSGNNKALVLVLMYPAAFLAAAFAGGVGTALGIGTAGVQGIVGLLVIIGAIAYVWGIFIVRDAMWTYYNTVENIGITLSGPMTLFFGTIYLQYHVNRIARWKKTGVLS